jgi:hypothetical protein
MHFEENQLSPRSIGISPLPTVHPSTLQRTTVRPSTTLYRRFSLTMGRSRGFGSDTCHHQRALHTRFRWASVAEPLKRRHTSTRRLILQKARRHPGRKASGLRLIVGDAVSGTISLPSRGAFHPSLTVLCAIGDRMYLALGDGPPGFPQGPSCPAVLGESRKRSLFFNLRGSHPLWPGFPTASAKRHSRPPHPRGRLSPRPRTARRPV